MIPQFLKYSMNTNPLNYIYIYFKYLLVPYDDISYINRTNTCIKIYINLIEKYWITNIYRDFFGPYMNKVKYCLIIGLDCYWASILWLECILNIESLFACSKYFVYHKQYLSKQWIFLYFFTLMKVYLYINNYKTHYHMP